MMKIFNSVFEMRLRILLLLSQTKRSLSKDEIVNYDFITVYGSDFEIGSENLHGDNAFKYGEFASRHELAWLAIKQLVVDGFVTVVTRNGFNYKINQAGLKYINSLDSAYSIEYREIARNVFKKYESFSEKDLGAEIDKKAIESARRLESCTI